VRHLGLDDTNLSFCTKFPDRLGYIEAYLPGYSRDGKSALFVFRFGPDPHDALGFYVLEKANEGWEIRWRRFVHFH
jgi:hypothetical protein